MGNQASMNDPTKKAELIARSGCKYFLLKPTN